MSLKTKILISVFVVVVVLITGWFVFNWQTNKPTKILMDSSSNNVVNKEKKVSVVTNKIEYSQGEEVKAELVFEGTIYEWGESGYLIQKWENNFWKDIFISRGCHPLPDCKNANFEEVNECLGYALCERPIWYKIEKGVEGDWRTKWTWNQMGGKEKLYQCREVNYEWSGGTRVPIYGGIIEEKCMEFQQVPAGKYKIKFEYSTAIDLDNPYKKEMDIKYAEQEILIR